MNKDYILTLARETLGLSYAGLCRINGYPMDCAGVPLYVAQKIGIDVCEALPKDHMPSPEEVRALLEQYMVRVESSNMQVGDVVWLRVKGTRVPKHLGMLGSYRGGRLSLIHARNDAGLNKVVEHRLDQEWLDRIVAVWRFPGVE